MKLQSSEWKSNFIPHLPKIQILEFCNNLYTRHTFWSNNDDKMCKYEMDPAITVEDTEQTRFCPLTDGRTDDVKPVYPPFNFVEAGGITILYV